MTEFSLDRSNIAGVVLAGGRSQRMGHDKAGVMLGAESLLRHALTRLSQQTLLVAVNADTTAEGVPVVPDLFPGKAGPMAGIHAAMVYASGLPSITHVVTVSVDCPFFPADLVARLAAAVEHPSQIAIAASEGRSHPVFGLWPVTLSADLEAWIATDEKRRVRDFLSRHDVTEVVFPLHPTRASLLDPFFNINTPDDLVEAERWLEALRA
ncbi:molybdenum cofactor guanylyltransferase [Rhizobium sophorae]|uniref:Molybdenum cofactor guanylyltransferase n=1 Tax=Rhizobium sophorae TaxID=1535242 RepID=A0A7Y3WHF8_9HYPH|nr:molybdenum cofactor guanylyltransferase MobA [Rhizobium sophorae]MBX4861176.1 molybdenum cofactor guanylyltransferase [Rhizobium bangladeshense]NNU40046.1 molybdenum cofactor guanylyltransferase [Rhizobium sophorae]